METFKLKLTSLQHEIFRLLCKNVGRPLNQSAMAKMLKVSSTAIAKAMIPMEKAAYLKIEKQGEMNLVNIRLNRTQIIMQIKRTENLKMLYESGILAFLEEHFRGTTIILFGSYSRGDDTYTSDIDLAIIGTKEKDRDLSAFEKTLEKKVSLNFYGSFKEIHKDLMENLCNGIVLAGGITL